MDINNDSAIVVMDKDMYERLSHLALIGDLESGQETLPDIERHVRKFNPDIAAQYQKELTAAREERRKLIRQITQFIQHYSKMEVFWSVGDEAYASGTVRSRDPNNVDCVLVSTNHGKISIPFRRIVTALPHKVYVKETQGYWRNHYVPVHKTIGYSEEVKRTVSERPGYNL